LSELREAEISLNVTTELSKKLTFCKFFDWLVVIIIRADKGVRVYFMEVGMNVAYAGCEEIF
jgi:hypothetical protein